MRPRTTGTDLAFQVREAGLKVYYRPRSVVVHHEGISHGTDTSSGGKAYMLVNQGKFVERWKQRLQAGHYPNGQDSLPCPRPRPRPDLVAGGRPLIPQRDRDAGSRAMLQTIQQLCAMGHIVKFWPQNHYYDPVYRGDSSAWAWRSSREPVGRPVRRLHAGPWR